jgi:glycerol-3-phosphate O-acyltransferase/dihydroxyacetone phosphate acyltransferase
MSARKTDTKLAYDSVLAFWNIVTRIFFREVRPRGAFNIPRVGPVIFVAAPHHNQARPPFYWSRMRRIHRILVS